MWRDDALMAAMLGGFVVGVVVTLSLCRVVAVWISRPRCAVASAETDERLRAALDFG